MNVLAVIPARGGSKGIPRKNLRPLGNKPLVAWAIEACLAAPSVSRVVVSTDSDEIAVVAQRFGAEVLMRDEALARDAVTLDPVIHDAVTRLEDDGQFDLVLTVQPTSPLLRTSTIERGIRRMAEEPGIDTLLTAVDDTHLAWEEGDDGVRPAYTERLNRQQLTARYRETGGLFVTRRSSVTPTSRIGTQTELIVVDSLEGIDIDGPDDWLMAEAALGRRRFAFFLIGNRRQGLGHVSRTMTLMESLSGHICRAFCSPEQELAIRRFGDAFFPLTVVPDDQRMQALAEFAPDLVIHDELDTPAEAIEAEKAAGYRVVCFEDTGARGADLVFNALYPASDSTPGTGRWFGPQVYCLRPEFRHVPKAGLRDEVEEVLVTFGGTDPSRLTYKALDALAGCRARVTVVAGLGFQPVDELEDRCAALKAEGMQLELLFDVPLMSELMQRADLALSSAGRTLYELAALGVPTVVMAQNEQELKHTFASPENGFLCLGLGTQVRPEALAASVQSLLQSRALRESLQRRMLDQDLTGGLDRVVRKLLELP